MRGVGSIKARIEESYIPEPNSGCWLWLGHVKANGYATLSIKKSSGIWGARHAHRLSYEEFVGPIPAGLDLDHKCRVRCCVNPRAS